MTTLTLPPVAKSFYTSCKKCGADRYHVVLAHTSSTSAKMQCEICKSKKTFTIPKEGTPKKVVRTGASSTNKSTGAYKPRNHSNDYELRHQNQLMKEAIAYSIKQTFKENQKVQHPKFGLGFVIKVLPDRVDVIFTDEVRTLIHNKN